MLVYEELHRAAIGLQGTATVRTPEQDGAARGSAPRAAWVRLPGVPRSPGNAPGRLIDGPPHPQAAEAVVAEDRRFELLRGCPQHAFQQCYPAFTDVRNRP
jgi:hypothetical protein